MRKHQIGILTWHHYSNFGSVLQTYAIQEIYRNFGYSTIIINYHSKITKTNLPKRIIKFLLLDVFKIKFLNKKIFTSFTIFRKDYLEIGKEFTSKKQLVRVCNRLKIVSCGSDQIWAPNVLDTAYLLYGVDTTARKISFSASIGLPSIPREYEPIYRDSLNDFDFISVREKCGKEILNKIVSKNIESFLDPTFLLDVDCWEKLASKDYKNNMGFRFAFFYLLKKNNSYNQIIKNFCNHKGIKPVVYSDDENNNSLSCINTHSLTPEQWIALIKNADCVITDSFHGTVFSLLFHKDFYTLKRFSNDDPINQNSRLLNIFDFFEINDRFLECDEFLKKYSNSKEIDYLKFQNKLNNEKKKELSLLHSKIEEILNDSN